MAKPWRYRLHYVHIIELMVCLWFVAVDYCTVLLAGKQSMLEINFRMAFQIRKKNKNTHNFTIPQPGHLRQFY